MKYALHFYKLLDDNLLLLLDEVNLFGQFRYTFLNDRKYWLTTLVEYIRYFKFDIRKVFIVD